MKTLRHPSFSDMELSVSDEEAEAWIASGWLLTDEVVEPTPTPNPRPSARAAEQNTEEN